MKLGAHSDLIRDTARRRIPNTWRRRVICRPTEFSSFKLPTLHVATEFGITLHVQESRITGSCKLLFQDGFDIELDIPVTTEIDAVSSNRRPAGLIGLQAVIELAERCDSNKCLSKSSPVKITIARRISKNSVLIRTRDLEIRPAAYAERLDYLLDATNQFAR